jgi:amino acid permease
MDDAPRRPQEQGGSLNRRQRAGAWIRSRFAWICISVLLVFLGWAVLDIGLDRAFLQTLLATFIGAVLGFLVALYIDRHQRAEDAHGGPAGP